MEREMAEVSLASQNNSTNGRTNHHRGIGAIRAGFACLSQISPGSAERFASYLFGKPKRVEIKPESMATMASAHRFDLNVGNKTLAAWSWGDGPTIILHHGWSGRASHLWRFVQPLLDAGFSVVAYDGPAHGDSPGKTTSMPEMARTLQEVAYRLTGIHGVVGHSFGCAVTMFAIRHGLRLDRAVLLAPPSDMNFYIDGFAETLGMRPEIRRSMEQYWIERLRFSWEDMDVNGWAKGERPPLLVFHDAGDTAVPCAQGEEVVKVWGNARLVTTTGLGHSRIREHDDVIREATSFLRER
jgi:pimeloyl-ACP methyl ester carboxylesterase